MRKHILGLSAVLDLVRQSIHQSLGKPSARFYAIALTPPTLALAGAIIFIVSSSLGMRSEDPDQVLKDTQIKARESLDYQARQSEQDSLEKDGEYVSSIREEYSSIVRENSGLSSEVSMLNKSAPLKAYVQYQQAQLAQAKAEKERENAALKKVAQAEMATMEVEDCVRARAYREARKAIAGNGVPPKLLSEDVQAIKELCD